MTLLADDALGTYFDSYQRTAWRFETQPTYRVRDPDLQFDSFRAGEPRPENFNEGWHNKIRGWIAAGKSISRVRTIRHPLTDYQRYGLEWYIPTNDAAGEKFRILDLTDDDYDLPNQDFWLFDDSIVIHLNFEPDGTWINAELIDEPDLAKYFAWRDTALKHSVPYAEYVGA